MNIKKELTALRDLLHNRILVSPSVEADVVRDFHKLYYNSYLFSKGFANTKWFGIPTLKCPLDLWLYQELIVDLRPHVLIETGTCNGGSALFLASMCDLVGNGRVITVDIEHREGRPTHPRIRYVHGSSVDDKIIAEIRKSIQPDEKVIVFLDSNHEKDHVLEELKLYRDFVTPGSYIIVEDTNINGHPVSPDFGPGPMEAIEEFLNMDSSFQVDKDKEKFYLTFNPRGFLLRKPRQSSAE